MNEPEGELARTKVVSNRNGMVALRHPVRGERNVIVPDSVMKHCGLKPRDVKPKSEIEFWFIEKGCGYIATGISFVGSIDKPVQPIALPEVRPGCQCVGRVCDDEPIKRGERYVYLEPIGFEHHDDWVFCAAAAMPSRLWQALLRVRIGFMLSFVPQPDPGQKHLRAENIEPYRP